MGDNIEKVVYNLELHRTLHQSEEGSKHHEREKLSAAGTV